MTKPAAAADAPTVKQEASIILGEYRAAWRDYERSGGAGDSAARLSEVENRLISYMEQVSMATNTAPLRRTAMRQWTRFPCTQCGGSGPFHRDSSRKCAACLARNTAEMKERRRVDPIRIADRRIVEASEPVCVYCGHAGSERNPLEVDHIFPIIRGGTSERGNLTRACRRCNRAKEGN
jgi:5-methylcytosine-specific restriction endonuclease McrA